MLLNKYETQQIPCRTSFSGKIEKRLEFQALTAGFMGIVDSVVST